MGRSGRGLLLGIECVDPSALCCCGGTGEDTGREG